MFRFSVVAAALCVLAAACSGGSADPTTTAPTGTVYIGADGVESTITDISRIVTLSGDLTEEIYAMGFGDHIVGRDVTTVYPEEALAAPVVGLGRFLTAEGVLEVNPTLVLGDTQTAPLDAIEQIRSAGVPVVIFDVPTSFDSLYEKMRAVGTVLGVPDAGATLADETRASIESTTASATPLDPVPGLAYVYTRGPDVMLLFGAEMTTEPLIEAAGARDVGAESGVVGDVTVTPEALVAAAPDVIIVPQEGLDAFGGVDGLLAVPGFAETPAGQAGRILAYPEGDFLTFGPRIADSLQLLITDLRAVLESP